MLRLPQVTYMRMQAKVTVSPGFTGYETSPRVKSMSPGQQPLTHHQREIVELLDPHPVLGYLVQNGALHQKDVDAIQSEESQVKVNLTLLSKLQDNGRRAQNLLVNALRQTGQLHLANLLDEGIRIKTFSGSGYLSKKRHRGQITLHIELKALKFDQDAVYSLLKSPRKAAMSREWVSADDLRQRISQIMDSQTKLSSVQQFQFIETCDDDPSKETSCLCACFASLFSKKKKKEKAKSTSSYLNGDSNGNNGQHHQHNHHLPVHPSPSLNSNSRRGVSPSRYISHTTTRISSADTSSKPLSPPSNSMQDLTHSRTSLENLRNLLDLFRQKTEDVHEVLQDSASKTRNGLIKYFEQDRGILVLDTEEGEGFVVRIICTKLQHLESLKKDLGMGKVGRDLEKCIVTEELLQRTGLLGIKIKPFIDQDEVESVEQELEG